MTLEHRMRLTDEQIDAMRFAIAASPADHGTAPVWSNDEVADLLAEVDALRTERDALVSSVAAMRAAEASARARAFHSPTLASPGSVSRPDPAEMPPLPMSDGELLAYMGTDARRWADRYLATLRTAPDGSVRVNWGHLVTWFANAIEAGRNAWLTEEVVEPTEKDTVRAVTGEGE